MASFLGLCQRCAAQIRRPDRPWRDTDLKACGPCEPVVKAEAEQQQKAEAQAVAAREARAKKAADERAADKAKRAAAAQQAGQKLAHADAAQRPENKGRRIQTKATRK
jgi:hypothetical protein